MNRSAVETDTMFFTNQPDSTLLDRFKSTLQDVKYFDVWVGYFRSSGFYQLHDLLDQMEKIRILVGLNIGESTYELHQAGQQIKTDGQMDMEALHKAKEHFSESLEKEMEGSEDSARIEDGVKKFIELMNTDVANPELDKEHRRQRETSGDQGIPQPGPSRQSVHRSF